MYTNYSCYQPYGMVPESVKELFIQSVLSEQNDLRRTVRRKEKSSFIVSVAKIMTCKCLLVLKCDRFIFCYNGKIYVKTDKNALITYLRELCECICPLFEGLNINAGFVSLLSKEIFQLAGFAVIPPDISNYIVFQNCILNLCTMTPEPFRPGFFVTSMVNACWNNSIFGADFRYCPALFTMMNSYSGGDILLLYRMLESYGLQLTNDPVKVLLCYQGVSNSGKSTMQNFITGLINQDVVLPITTREFTRLHGPVKFYGKSLAVINDMPDRPLNEEETAFLKQISGSDPIGMEQKHQDGNIFFKPNTHVVLTSNYSIEPEVYDHAFSNRKVVIPFPYPVSNAVRMDNILAVLETEKDAIVNILVKAYLNLRRNNYIFSGTGSWYDTYIPENGGRNIGTPEQRFIRQNCIRTDNADDRIFAQELADEFNRYTYINSLPISTNPQIISHALRTVYPDIVSRKTRITPGGNPQCCFTGIRWAQ